MEIESKYLKFKLIANKPKTKVMGVYSKSGEYSLGWIEWYSQWRRYCFFPERGGLVFSKGCLKDINFVITKLMDERK